MLILPKSQQTPVKNPCWEPPHQTPNELYGDNLDYTMLINRWAKENGIKPKNLFMVRIVNQKSFLDLKEDARWWDDARWMDKIFWVYQSPISFRLPFRTEAYQCYALEYFECQRVVFEAVKEFGYNPFMEPAPSLLLPVDVVQVVWDERTAGVSEHIRYDGLEREQKKKTPEAIEREAMIAEEVNERKSLLRDVSNSTDFDASAIAEANYKAQNDIGD